MAAVKQSLTVGGEAWEDRPTSSLHRDGHRVGNMAGVGEVDAWWFYHAAFRRVRLQTLGPEPRGPFSTREEAKAALDQVAVEAPAPARGMAAVEEALGSMGLEDLVAGLEASMGRPKASRRPSATPPPRGRRPPSGERGKG